MKIIFQKKFWKNYRKLSPENKIRVRTTLWKFRENPFDPSLKNHVLAGKLAGLRTISAGYDLRLIFEEDDGFVEIIFLTVGTHAETYF